MKKVFFLVAMLATMGVATAVAQPRAIGGQIGNGLEFSYEHTLGNNFLSADLGFPGWFYRGFGIEGAVTYNWLNPFGADFPTVSQGDWNWYMGPGLGLGGTFYNYSYWSMYGTEWINTFYIGAAGRFGVEYNFWFPLQLSVEWRPMVGPMFTTDSWIDGAGAHHSMTTTSFNVGGLYWNAFMIGVRYKF